MKTAVILITHPEIGESLLRTAQRIMQDTNLDVTLVEIEMDKDCQTAKDQLAQMINDLDQGQGVLILNDIYGATPFNIAKSVLDSRSRLLSGVNLNMLLRAITYQELELHELAEKTREGGINGVRLAE